MNHVTLVGRITRNITLRQSNSGKNYTFFSIAVSNGRDYTDFINCVAWNKVAENMTRFVGKGSLISVSGRLSARKDKNDQYILEVVANQVSFLESKKKTEDSMNNHVETSRMNHEPTTNDKVNIDEAFDNDISFVNNIDADSDDDAVIWD